MTHKQKLLLDFIKKFMDENDGVAPSYREMQDALGGASSTSEVHRLMKALVERGYVKQIPRRARALILTDPHDAAGHPLEKASLEDIAKEVRRRGYIIGSMTRVVKTGPDGKMAFSAEFCPIE